MAVSKCAFFFDEGPGYLFVHNIGTPCNGQVRLVRCIADGKLYIRKENFPITLYPGSNQTTCNEVRFYREHANIPKLIDSRDEIHLQIDCDHLSTTSYWEYCNGGHLSNFLADAQGQGIPIPEAFLWKLIYQLGTVLDFIHFGCLPSIGHGDFHSGNIFLHWEDDSSVSPEIKLGDFGSAHSYRLSHAYIDFCDFYNGLTNMVRQSGPRLSSPYSKELISAIEDVHDFYMEFSCFYRDDTLHPEDRRQVRSDLTSLLELTRSQYQNALTSISDQDREYMLRLKANDGTRVLMCDSFEALRDAEHQAPGVPCKVVKINAESLQVIEEIGDACMDSGIFPDL